MEPDLVQRLDVGRIGNRDEEAIAAFVERERMVAPDDVFLDELDDVGIDVDRADVDQRHAEFHAGGMGDVATMDQLVLDQAGDQRHLLVQGVLKCTLSVLLRKQAV